MAANCIINTNKGQANKKVTNSHIQQFFLAYNSIEVSSFMYTFVTNSRIILVLFQQCADLHSSVVKLCPVQDG